MLQIDNYSEKRFLIMKKKKMLAAVLSIAMIGCTMFTGCDSSSDAASKAETTSDGKTKVTLQLKWLPQCQFMGYYMAQKNGYYDDEDLEVEIKAGGNGIDPGNVLQSGEADIAVTWMSSYLTYKAQGIPFIEVAQIFQKSGLQLVSLKDSNINSPADLKGKKVGNWLSGNEYEVVALFNKYGFGDQEILQEDYTMDQLTKGEFAASSAMTYNELKLVLDAGYTMDDLNIIDMNDEGVGMLEDCIITNEEWAKENKDTLVKFLRASIKGWQDACKDTDAAAEYVTEVAGDGSSLEHQKYMASEVAKLVVPEGFDSAKIGYMDAESLGQTLDYSSKYMPKEEYDVSTLKLEDIYTTEYYDEAVK